MDANVIAVAAVAGLVALVAVSYIVEALRRQPAPPEQLHWAPGIRIRYAALSRTKVRYIATGRGPALLLLHSLGTQLDMFQKVVPELARHFRVYALDYPGHGFSDIPRTEYSAELFVGAVGRFLEQLDIRDACLVGESIGGTIALLLAARHNTRVRSVVAINPYDYDRGRGLRRSSALANIVFGLNNVPVVGATVARLRRYSIVKRVFAGGVFHRDALPETLAKQMYQVGERRGHYRAFMSLVRHWPDWERARVEYPRINRPTLLIYGDHDWSRAKERDADRRAIPGVRMRVIMDAGHFLSLDAPEQVVRAILDVSATRDLAG